MCLRICEPYGAYSGSMEWHIFNYWTAIHVSASRSHANAGLEDALRSASQMRQTIYENLLPCYSVQFQQCEGSNNLRSLHDGSFCVFRVALHEVTWCMVVWCTQNAPRRQQFHDTSHVSAVLKSSADIQKRAIKSRSFMYNHRESARKRRTVLYKSDHQQQHYQESRRDQEEGGDLDSHEELDYHLRVQARSRRGR